jgi:hypothetical protein
MPVQTSWRQYAKAIAAALSAGLTAAQTALPMSSTAHGWVTVALAVAGLVAVYSVPNAPAPSAPTEGGDR